MSSVFFHNTSAFDNKKPISPIAFFSHCGQDGAAKSFALENFMTKIRKVLVVGIVSALTVTIAFGADGKQSVRQNSGTMMSMPMVGALFLANQKFSSTLYMVNELNIPATAKVTLFDLYGAKIAEKNGEFKPNSQ